MFLVFQVHSPLNLKHPHDVVIFMRQDTRVNYLKKLEVCVCVLSLGLILSCVSCARQSSLDMFVLGFFLVE